MFPKWRALVHCCQHWTRRRRHVCSPPHSGCHILDWKHQERGVTHIHILCQSNCTISSRVATIHNIHIPIQKQTKQSSKTGRTPAGSKNINVIHNKNENTVTTHKCKQWGGFLFLKNLSLLTNMAGLLLCLKKSVLEWS